MRLPDQKQRVLLVEPDPLTGLDLADALEAAGYEVTGPIRTAAEAAVWLASWNPDVAVIGAEDAARDRLAGVLRERGVPFLLHAELNGAESCSASLKGVPLLKRPAWHRDVIDTMSRLASAAA